MTRSIQQIIASLERNVKRFDEQAAELKANLEKLMTDNKPEETKDNEQTESN